MTLHPKQIETVVALPGPERYNHFIKQVADSRRVWGLYQDGWAMAETDEGSRVFPLWPAEEYALLCAQNKWSGYRPEVIELKNFLNELLPLLERDGVLPGIFLTQKEMGVTPNIAQLREDLQHELSRYD